MVRDYASLDGLKKATQILIGAVMVAEVLTTLVEANVLKVGAALAAGTAGYAEADVHDSFAQPVYISFLAAYILAGIVFLVWVHRANKNLHAIGITDMQFSPGWAVGWWFVPFMNLVRGHTIVKELWQGSHSPGTSVGPDSPFPKMIDYWWGAWLLSGILSRISARIVSNDNPTLDQFRYSAYLAITASIFGLAAGWIAIKLVGAISDAQAVKRQRMRSEVHASSPPPDIQPPVA